MIFLLWLIATALVAGALRLPSTLDIYIKDYYFVVSRAGSVTIILVAFVLPLMAITVRRLRSALR